MKTNKNPIFEEFSKIFESEENFKITSQFMLNKLMSLTDKFKIAEECNKFIGKIPDKLLLLIYRKYIGNNTKTPWIKYPKKEKEKEIILLQNICKTFNCSIKHGKEIIDIYRANKIKVENLFGLEVKK